jgi:succinoglycan biosynthesis transport protein ExoP
VKTSGMEALQRALKRSVWLIVALVALGLIQMNVIRQLGGPTYSASARVVLDSADLSAAAANVNVPYVDPARKDEAERNLASSPEFLAFVARETSERYGSVRELDEAVQAKVANNVVSFTVEDEDGERAVLAANAVATAYPTWRAKVSATSLDRAIAELRSEPSSPAATEQLRTLRILRSLVGGQVLFVERALRATKLTPRPMMDSLIGLVVGLVVALVVVAIREGFNTTVRDESDVEDTFGMPAMATIDTLPRRLRAGILTPTAGRYADEFDLLAANVAQLCTRADGPARIAVTSAMSGEGKSTVAANLSAALARRSSNVVMIDFDVRTSSLTTMCGIEPDVPGVTEILAGTANTRHLLRTVSLADGVAEAGVVVSSIGSDVRDVVAQGERRPSARARVARNVRNSEGSLAIVPSGGPPRAGGTLRMGAVDSLFKGLPESTDFVVIDTPPALLVSVMTELAPSVHGVLVVAREGIVPRRKLRALARLAERWNGSLGVVLNGVRSDEPRGYTYGYGGRDR